MTPSSSPRAENPVLARGVRLALLGRMGAPIEIVSVFLFAQMYGSETFGLFFVLWSIAQPLAILSDFGMTMALQRFVPQETDDVRAGRILKYAINISLSISCAVALILVLLAPELAKLINANERDSQHLVQIIRIYAWAIPLWCLIDVATAAIRARQVFGPEVRVRVFYEQGFRLVFGSLFFLLGYYSFGLFVSHLIGLAATAILAFRLIHKYYGLGHLVARTGYDKAVIREMVLFSSSMIVPNLAKKWHSVLPVLFLNFLLPGAKGAEAAGIYGVARKIVSTLNVFRESFEYVLAPMTSAKALVENKAQLREMYAFATRISIAAFIPTATYVVFMRDEFLRLSGSEFLQGSMAIAVLALGRFIEVASGPSSSIIAMIGRYRMPLLNAAGGIVVTAAIAVWLIPSLGITGGAIAAAAGINVNSLAAHMEVRLFYGLQPYDRSLLRPTLMAVFISAPLAVIAVSTIPLPRTFHLIIVTSALLVALIAVIRFGYSQEDARSIIPGRLAKRLPFLTSAETN